MRRLTRWLRKALTRKIQLKRRIIEVEPSNRLVLGLYFAITALIALTILEAVHMLVLRSFSTEIFSAITGLIGTIVGVLLTSKG